MQLSWSSSTAVVAIIDSSPLAPTSSESLATPPPQRANIGAPASPSSARPSSRRTVITQQIYQFALGYPQTPPENSPVSEPVLSFEETKVEKDKMGTFLFKWYVILRNRRALATSPCRAFEQDRGRWVKPLELFRKIFSDGFCSCPKAC